ncbi:ABC transporter permease [Bacteroides pyogenes JCM 6292]|uniref:ABC transporter permease n=2 Tax=Bacteroides pyogenes TaxID=310300 RepID=W4PHG6_9BACE|nr:ABC transporter permease [Bacteroides pyogenes JCM 6292]GAE18579.1 ABC transporter permease [Bacteroides pyogenes DSM 20611 = JCM 6294]
MNNEMDTKIERKRQRFPRRKIVSGASILAIAGCALYLFFRDSAASLTVERSRITVGSVEKGEFNDYIQVIGQAVPARMVYLDAIEGGKVEERLYEEGAVVRQGDVILRLSNPLLNIGILQSEADLAYQENELRNTRIRMEQERLSLKQERIGMWKEYLMRKRRREQCRKLMNEDLIAREEYLRANEAFDAIHQQLATLDERIRQDSLFRLAQVSSLDENIRHMKQSLVLIRRRLENLKVKAPINGQVGNLDAQIGQSIAPGEHIGR